jgi:hypothetical protein
MDLVREEKFKKREENEENILNLIFPEEKPGRKSLHVHAGRRITRSDRT